MVNIEWKGELAFEAVPETGRGLLFDGGAEDPEGPSPMMALLGAIGACAAMDVISILEKKRQIITSYRIEVEGERPAAGQWPRPYNQIRVRHIVKGEGVDPAALARAIELSEEKYCSVLATLRENPKVSSEWVIE